MKKRLLIALGIVFFLAFVIIIISLVLAFSVVKPTTDTINKKLAQKLTNVIKIPEIVPPQTKNFEETVYFWEMETTEHEVVGVRFIHDTGLVKDKDTIEATLEIPPNGDPSIFNKVLPAIISDNQSLTSAEDPKKANLAANSEVGYSEIKLYVKPQTSQTNRIVWTFDKKSLTADFDKDYQKLTGLPYFVLKNLYLLQKTIFDLMGA